LTTRSKGWFGKFLKEGFNKGLGRSGGVKKNVSILWYNKYISDFFKYKTKKLRIYFIFSAYTNIFAEKTKRQHNDKHNQLTELLTGRVCNPTVYTIKKELPTEYKRSSSTLLASHFSSCITRLLGLLTLHALICRQAVIRLLTACLRFFLLSQLLLHRFLQADLLLFRHQITPF
jgi:hypothetical protein